MIYLCNALSPFMLPKMMVGNEHHLKIRRISAIEAGDILKGNAFRSFYGHPESVKYLQKYLRLQIPVSRGFVQLDRDDILIIATIQSKRAWEQGRKPAPTWRFFKVEMTK